MEREHILTEIRRTAIGGRPLGSKGFHTATGIREHEWRGKHWARWGDAVIEAGYLPNEWTPGHEESHIFQSLIELTRKLKRYPTGAEISIERKTNAAFPSARAIQAHSNKAELIGKLLDFCQKQAAFRDVEQILKSTVLPAERKQKLASEDGALQFGYVYLLLSARHYKIGFSKAVLNRASVVSSLTPEGGEIIHLIRTDDMKGIEAYWHRRFADKRGNGEWFALSSSDVAAFKRRKFM
ncbi:MAG: GIY-YIG nuclease family protein [Acidobacteriota bacterium]